MRIALVHSYYSSRQPSGENVVVDAQAAVLADAGHEVLVVAQRTDRRERRRSYPLEAAWTVATGNGPDPTDELRAFAPDVVHVHNLFPNFGTKWLAGWHGPIVATLHNFRPMCAGGTLQRDGSTCTLCPDGSPLSSLRHGCYRDSRAATVPLTLSLRGGPATHPVVSRADALITLSPTWADMYATYGVNQERLHAIPNFVGDPGTGSSSRPSANGPDQPGNRWLFVGRMTPEKGLVELLTVWPDDEPLDVVGDGPLAARVAALARGQVRLLGTRPSAWVRRHAASYLGLVVPSRWFEGALPLVYLEGLAAGLPVLALEGSSTAEDVATHLTGRVLSRTDGPDAWRSAADDVRRHRSELTARAREEYLARFSARAWLEATEGVYARAIERRSDVARTS